MTKTCIALLGLLVACGSKSTDNKGAGSGSGAGSASGSASGVSGLTRVPNVTVAQAIVANPSTPPPVVLLLDENGALFANHVATWDELAAKDPMRGAYPTDRKRAVPLLAAGRVLGRAPNEIYEMFEPPGPSEVELQALEDAEGHDKVNSGEPDVVRMRRTEPARAQLMAAAGMRRPGDGPSGRVTPLTTAVGEVIQDGKLEQPAYAVLLAAPSAKATDFIDTIAATHAWLAVAHDGKVRPLRIDTIPERSDALHDDAPPPGRWIELRVGKTDLAFEAVPDVPVPLSGAFDQNAFAAALAKARESRSLAPLARVDVLVEPDVNVQRTIDMLVALDQAGVVMIGLGRAPEPGSEQAHVRGVRPKEGPVKVVLGELRAQGALDKARIQATVARKLDRFRACSAKQAPGYTGTVQTQFFITPNGNVASSSGSGVDPWLASCVADVIKGLEFPKPKEGGVEASYSINFE